jgi:hypothetical protein
MKTTRFAAVIAAAVTAMGITTGSASAGALDQSQLSFDASTAYIVGPHRDIAQTFVAGVTGDLDRVDLSAFIYDGRTTEPLTVQIRPITATPGPYASVPGPSDTVLASTTVSVDGVSQWGTGNPLTLTTAQFAEPARVRKGHTYAIVLADDARDPNNYSLGWFVTEDTADPYLGGMLWSTQFWPTPNWSPIREYMDMAFRTYVIPGDADPPEMSVTHSATGGDGWNNAAVTVTIAATDAAAGLAGPPTCTDNGSPLSVAGNASPYTATVDGDGTHLVGCSASDTRNNVGTATDTVKIDTVPPRVYVDWPTDGQVFVVDATSDVLGIGCRTEDEASGVAVDAHADPDYYGLGGPATGFVALYGYGNFTSSCAGATDVAGNTAAPRSVHFSVVYPWTGFYSPVDNTDGNGRYVLNAARAGSTVPVKFSLGGDHGLDVVTAGSPSSAPIACDSAARVDPVEEYAATSASGLRYEQGADRYAYNWQTDRSWAGSCRKLIVRLNDGTRHEAQFMFTP